MESHRMSQSSRVILDDRPVRRDPAARRGPLALAIHDDLAAVEEEWRRFEAGADCTVFQTFDWLACWHEHVGRRNGVCPAIVVGRRDSVTLLLLPLAIVPGVVRRLTFLGSEL